ncbi:uncharacterized protein STEHIDRAFT_121827 [Stereum hirsutum FP-91666 SS1]|uniref:uncharacterized protein n=1 Tax=Stereum hirsutum (strain FP-91666) TaxID=721885 RepID=UPI000444920D|nr:uncharacterized protein STEHIDRAFT_121827 [Stereum hirsutum FP-91666 SS1]EIM85804.1 hypothetical protein STEHIDRAFT_121827 [Stereum hirsutum FP-91666 SS1]
MRTKQCRHNPDVFDCLILVHSPNLMKKTEFSSHALRTIMPLKANLHDSEEMLVISKSKAQLINTLDFLSIKPFYANAVFLQVLEGDTKP